MKKSLSLSIIGLLIYTSLSAQENFYGTRNPLIGSSMYLDDKSENLYVEGSAYLADEWRMGFVKKVECEAYEKVKLNYSYLEDKIYLEGKGSEISSDIVEFSIAGEKGHYHLFKKGFNAIENFDKTTFFEVLAEGRFVLLKKLNKRIEESRAYGSAIINYSIVDRASYYIYANDKMVKLKKDNEVFKALLAELRVDNFISKEGLDLKKETDVKKLAAHLNNQ